ncbi:MAG: winged helix-turn-helix domain-containing protein [Rhodospirillaceae bacterium]|nr:winged helix-turn-helix domain-containing protein [Rhodospirillaceae bacterium]
MDSPSEEEKAAAYAARVPRITLKPPFRLVAPGRTEPLHPQEHTILLALMLSKYNSAELLAEILWPHPDDMPDTWNDVVSVRVCHLRRKLKDFGWAIPTSNRRGWTLEEK